MTVRVAPNKAEGVEPSPDGMNHPCCRYTTLLLFRAFSIFDFQGARYANANFALLFSRRRTRSLRRSTRKVSEDA